MKNRNIHSSQPMRSSPSLERPSAQIITTPSSSNAVVDTTSNQQQSTRSDPNSYYQPGYFANRGASRSSAERQRSADQQHAMEIEELKIKIQQEKSKSNHAEEAVIRKDKELGRVREELERFQREALKSGTNAASLEAELAATKVQLSEALSSRDSAVKNYRELQTLHRQVESSREEAMHQLNELTHELELVRKAGDDKSQPLTQMLSQLTNRLANIEEARQRNSAARARSRSSDDEKHDREGDKLREMQQSIVNEALSRYEISQNQKGKDFNTMLEESEKIKNILKGQLEVAQSQIATLETKFRAAAEFNEKNKQQLTQRKWLLLQRKWLAQLLREYDLCFRQFPTVLPWFRMPQRKCLRVYVWAVIAALRMVKGPSCLSDNLPQIKRYFAISANRCSPAAVFRKIHSEIDHLNGNNISTTSSGSPLAHLPSNGSGTVVFHSMNNNNAGGAGGRNFVFPGANSNNNNSNSANTSTLSHQNQNHHHLNHHHSYQNNNTSQSVSFVDQSGVNVDPDDITAILGEIHNIDSRISRALRAHGDHVVTISDRNQYPNLNYRNNVYSGGGDSSSTNVSRNSHNSSTMVMFAP